MGSVPTIQFQNEVQRGVEKLQSRGEAYLARQVAQLLADETLKIKWTDEKLEIDGEPRDCLNSPETRTITCNRSDWQTVRLSGENASSILALHEMFSVLGIESEGDYRRSRPTFEQQDPGTLFPLKRLTYMIKANSSHRCITGVDVYGENLPPGTSVLIEATTGHPKDSKEKILMEANTTNKGGFFAALRHRRCGSATWFVDLEMPYDLEFLSPPAIEAGRFRTPDGPLYGEAEVTRL